MSQTVPVGFRGAHFWAQETAMGFFLKHFIVMFSTQLMVFTLSLPGFQCVIR